MILRPAFEAALAQGPVVLTSPTGSGKSTEVPRWAAGRVLVIEPRRIACRSLAARVAQREGCELGAAVGYIVRDEHVASAATRLVFATPGIALRTRGLVEAADTLILDEFHERNLEVDLLLALAVRARRSRLVVMSATLDAERVAQHIGGVHLHASGRSFPVEIRYLPGRDVLPSAIDLPERVRAALLTAADDPGDVLVFLPGKAEIDACAQILQGYAVVPLHGGLSLAEQRRAFEPRRGRKVVLATNVAETALTIAGIGVVIDTGLVRQTHYENGRGYLALGAIAQDSAEQRAGRAGRTAPGACYRLWSAGAALRTVTPPEIHRESLTTLLLAAAAWEAPLDTLPLLDRPKPEALQAALADLSAWSAIDRQGAIAPAGRSLFALPVAPAQARMLVAARAHGCLDAMIDLVAVLAVGRPLFAAAMRSDVGHEADLRAGGCDATAVIKALRSERPASHGASEFVVREARQGRSRLRRLQGLPDLPPEPSTFDREALIRACIEADPRMVYLARKRGMFSNGGTEVALARESAANEMRELVAVIALEVRGFGEGRQARGLITCAMPIALHVLARAGLGSDRLGTVRLEHGRVIAAVERVYAKRVIAEREETPSGELAREAVLTLLLRGSLFREAVATTRERLVRSALAAKLAAKGGGGQARLDASSPEHPRLEDWLRARVQTLGVESGEDVALLSASDFTLPDLSYELRAPLDAAYPAQVSVGDATYRADYDLDQNQVVLHMIKGSRRDPPPLGYLPKFPGLRICVEGPRGLSVVRPHG
jgi:ATP-dependent helicase HrpB